MLKVELLIGTGGLVELKTEANGHTRVRRELQSRERRDQAVISDVSRSLRSHETDEGATSGRPSRIPDERGGQEKGVETTD